MLSLFAAHGKVWIHTILSWEDKIRWKRGDKQGCNFITSQPDWPRVPAVKRCICIFVTQNVLVGFAWACCCARNSLILDKIRKDERKCQ